MKKNYKTKKMTRLLILLTIMSLMLFGCGSTKASKTPENVSEEKEKENEVVEETTEETPTVKEEVKTTEKTIEADETNKESEQMVDWETFATQANNNEICLVVSNEQTSTQTVLFNDEAENSSTCFYNYVQGDRVAVPIKDNITRVCYYVAEIDGTQKTDIQNVYWKDDGEKLSYVEINIENEPQYYISIFDNENNKYTFGLYK